MAVACVVTDAKWGIDVLDGRGPGRKGEGWAACWLCGRKQVPSSLLACSPRVTTVCACNVCL